MRIALITDIHEDFESLKQALKLIEKYACDEIICLGDICGFSIPYYSYYNERNASKCVKLIKDNCKYTVIGNHDLYAIRKVPENSFSFDFPKDWYNKNYFERERISKNLVWLYEENELTALLDEDDIDFLDSLPEFINADFDDMNIFISHYIYPDITGSLKKFLYETQDFKKHYDFTRKEQDTICVFGHMHPQGILYIDQFEMKISRKSFILNEKTMGISGPCISQNEKFNGFTIIDTINKTAEPIFLRKTGLQNIIRI